MRPVSALVKEDEAAINTLEQHASQIVDQLHQLRQHGYAIDLSYVTDIKNTLQLADIVARQMFTEFEHKQIWLEKFSKRDRLQWLFDLLSTELEERMLENYCERGSHVVLLLRKRRHRAFVARDLGVLVIFNELMTIRGKDERHIKPLRVSIEFPLFESIRWSVVFGFCFNQCYSDGLRVAANLNAQRVICTPFATPARSVINDLNRSGCLFALD